MLADPGVDAALLIHAPTAIVPSVEVARATTACHRIESPPRADVLDGR